MSRHVADAIEQIHAIASAAPRFYRLGEHEDAHLSPAELAEQYRESCEAPDDEFEAGWVDEPAARDLPPRRREPRYAMSVWDAVNSRWVEC